MKNVKELKFKEDWTDKKSFISTFASFLIATVKVEFLEDRLSTRLCLYPNLGLL